MDTGGLNGCESAGGCDMRVVGAERWGRDAKCTGRWVR